MILANRVGLLLRSAGEHEILRAAALNCGLEPEDLERAPGGENDAAECRIFGQSGTALRVPQLIITDDELAAQKLRTSGDGHTFRACDSPLLILVRDENPRTGIQDQESDSAARDVAFEFALYRPLQQESATALLRRAAHASRAFAEQHSLVLEELHLSRRIFDSVSNGITICDANLPDLPLVYVNPAFERLTGYTAEEACGRNCRFLQGSDRDQPGVNLIREAIRDKRDARALLKNYRKDGTPFWNELYLSPILSLEGRLTHFVGIQNEVTAQVESSRRLDYLANHDALTGVANRGLLMEHLKHALLRAQRGGGSVAVLFFDLDNFKNVNDIFGHDAGDNLLRIVAERLRAGTRAGEVVARLGGDEFVVVLEDISDDRQPLDVMKRLTSSVSQPVDLFEKQFRPSASVGMALFPRDGSVPDALLRAADFNMYIAKHEARSAYQRKDEDGGSNSEVEPVSTPDPDQ